MSSIKLESNASGTGVFTIASPNSNTNRTLSIPDTTTTIVGTDATQTLTNKTLGSGLVMGASTLTSETAKAYNWNGLTTNTSLDFTGIPSWVKRIVVMFISASTNGTSNLQVQLGTGTTPTYTTSGYLGSSISTSGGTTVGFSSGLLVSAQMTIGRTCHGQLIINNITGNTWVGTSTNGFSDANGGAWAAGSIALSGVLTAVRFTTVSGTDVFDAGTINILYE